MVDPAVSGVMFTINPLTGSWREMVVESVWGLAEGLVGGEIAPHWALVHRPRRVPGVLQRLWSRVRLEVMQQDNPNLCEQWSLSAQGDVVREPTPPSLRGQPTVERRTLLRLCRVGLRVEALMGAPQDVEWCIDRHGHVLVIQSRPITSNASPRARSDVLWTRRFIGERFSVPVTPLGWSVLGPLLSEFIAYPRTQDRYLGGGPALRLVNGRPFVNATVFRHLAFKLPGAAPPRFMLELLPPAEELAWRSRQGAPPDISVYLSLLKETFEERRWERFAFNPLTNPSQWEAFRGRLERLLPSLCRAPSSAPDAVDLVGEQLELIREYVSIHITSLLFANLSYQLLERVLARWAPESAALWLEALAVCPPGNRTLEVNAALVSLASVAEDSDLVALQGGAPVSERFRRELDRFLVAYGHRSDASWVVFADRWRDRPSMLVPLLRSATEGGSKEPASALADQEARFHRVQSMAIARVGPLQRAALRQIIGYNRTYLLLRENQRFAFDQLSSALRDTLVWIGHSLVDQGALVQAVDVRFLTWGEARALVTEGLEAGSARRRVEKRKIRYEADKTIEPPTFLLGDEAVVVDAGGTRLQGVGISSGRVRGRVRVVHSVAEAGALQPGEVLVTRSTDPGWTPLFMTASAVVLEMGSMLSHGAVIAREYRVPMVVNLDGITQRLRTGQEITVDGTRGIVWVHG